MADKVELRTFTEGDLTFLDRWNTDPAAVGPFEWMGFADPHKRRRRYEKDGYVSAESTTLVVSLTDDTPIGTIGFGPKNRGGAAGACFEIGLCLLPEFRGRGLGTDALRQLISYLFDYTTVNRIEALTDEEVAERYVVLAWAPVPQTDEGGSAATSTVRAAMAI